MLYIAVKSTMKTTTMSCSMDLYRDNDVHSYQHVNSTPTKYKENRNRRNSIPPAQTPKGKHMLAYLPRLVMDAGRYGTFSVMVGKFTCSVPVE